MFFKLDNSYGSNPSPSITTHRIDFYFENIYPLHIKGLVFNYFQRKIIPGFT